MKTTDWSQIPVEPIDAGAPQELGETTDWSKID